jgi:hypothetical protein
MTRQKPCFKPDKYAQVYLEIKYLVKETVAQKGKINT